MIYWGTFALTALFCLSVAKLVRDSLYLVIAGLVVYVTVSVYRDAYPDSVLCILPWHSPGTDQVNILYRLADFIGARFRLF